MKHARRYSLPSNPESTARPLGRLRLWCGLAAGLLLCAATAQAGPATGKPTISGAPQVGEFLTADTSDIEDTDGLGTFSYQWIQVDDLTETNIPGATSSTYTPVAADIGKTLKVKVNFTDGEGNAETLTSDAYPSAGYPVVAIVAAKTTCPTDSDWCAEIGVGYQGIFSVGGTDLYLGYDMGSGGQGHLGTLSDTDVSHGESTYAFASIKLVSRSGISYVQVKLDGPMPMGTVFNLGGTTFTANPVDWIYLSPGNGEYKFITPSGFGMVEGQKMTVSVKFPADVTDNSGDVIDPPISSRTRAVKAAIVAASGVQTAAAVTAEHLANITTLDLSEKSIASLTAGDFNGLTQLVQLDLNNNDLSSLPSGIFSELTALKNLDLSHNRLSALPAGLFDDATALREVQLQFNELSTLPAGIFKNSSELRDFDVEQNNLTSLPADIFQDTPKLYRLFMRQNELESVSSDLVSGLSNLFLFHIGFNNLDSFPAGFFVGLTNLKWLYVMGSTSSYTTPFTVSLEKVEDGKVKAVIREGAPYDIQVHVTVENGSLADDATLIAIPQGVVESEAIAVTRTPGTTGAVTVDIERYGVTLPTGLPVHRGFELVKPTTGLPVEIYAEVALSLSTSSVDEDAGATSITVTGTLNGTTRTADTPVTVAVGSSGDTATEGTDYATVNDLTLTILAGETSGTASFTLTPTDDDVDEADETLSVSGTTTATDLSVTGTTATIVDDDERGVEVSATTLSVSEGGTATYTVALKSKPTDTVTVAQTASGDADVTVSPSSLSFITGNWSTAQTVTVSAAPDAAARGDRAMIAHAASGGDYGSVSIDAVSVTVAPGQVTGVTVSAGSEELAVTWDAVSNADGYKVQWKSGSETFAGAATDNREATIASSTTTSYAITGLTNGTAYSVQVIATRANSDDGTASATATATPVAQARITSVEFTNVPSSGVYGLGSTIEVSASFDAAVEVTGMPQIQLTFPSTTMSNKYVHYDDAASTDRVLVFKRLVTGDDDEEESGIRVDTNSLELNGGTIKNKGTSVNADISHSYVTGPNAKTRWVESIAVTSAAAAGRVYGPDEKIEFTVTFESPVYVDQTGGNPQLFFQARNSSTTYAAAYESGTDTKELVFAWTVPAAVADDGAELLVPSNVYNLSVEVGLHNDRGLVLNGGAIENRSGVAVNIRHEEHDLGVQVDTTTPVLASGADGATVDGTTLVLTFQNPNNSNLPDQLDENSVPAPTDFAVTVAGSAQTVSSVDVSGATVTLSLASPVGYAQTVTMGYTPGTNPVQDLAGNDAASITGHSVRNDSPQPSLSIQDATVAEDDGTAVFAVTLDVASGELVAVDYATADGTGAAGSDYTAASGTLTFAAGETTGTIEVAVADDAIDEEDESFTVTLSNPVTATIASATAMGTITDDDTASTEVTLSVSLVAMSEDAGATTVTVTAELDESARTSATEVTVSVGDSGDGATEGTDYATVSDFTLTIAAGQTTGTATFTLTPTDDDVDELDETLAVDGTVQDLTVTATTVSIEDDDTRGIALSPTNLTVAEGRSKSYTVVLSSQPTADVTVTPSVSGDSDVTVAPSKLTFTEDNWDQAQTVTVSAAQDADAEDASATIAHAVSGGDYGSVAAEDVEVTVTDDETASTKVTLSVSATSVDEDAGSTSVTVTAELDESARTSATEVTVSVGAAGDGATEGTDYATVSDFTLTIAAGQTSGTASFTLTPTDDDVDEEDEPLTVDGTVQSLTVTGTSLTIEDNDTRGIEVSSTDLTVEEDAGSSTYTVVLESQPTADVTVAPSVSGDADVTVAPSTLTFAEDNWDQPQTVTVSAAQDADADDSSATITHAVSGGDYGSETADDVEVTVTDNDVVAIHTASITLCGATLGSTTGVAYDSSVDICWDTEGPIPTGSDVVIEERVKKFQDYPDPFSSWQEIARGNNFTPCSSDDNSCVKYTRTGLMRAESFTQELRIRRGSDVLGTSPQLEAAAPNSNENGLQAQLSQAIDEDTWAFIGKPTGPFVVGLVFSEPDLGTLYSEAVRGLKTDDFRMTNGTVTAIEVWNGGSYKVRVTPTTLGEPVTIKLKAKTVRGVGEGITDAGKNAFTRSNTGSNKVVQETAAAAGKVTATPGLSVADAEVDEGADATLSFQVTLSRAASGSVAVDWATADGTATAGQDYTAARGTLTFATGETSQTVTVSVLDDTHDEGTETLTLTLSNPSGAWITDGTATGTIINSDPMPQAWLARFGRTVADQVLTAVNNRARTARTARVPGFEARVAGQRLEGLLASDEEEEPEAARHQKVDGPSSKRDERGTWLREVTARDFVTGSSFALTGETQESGFGSLWGQGTLARFDGRKGDLSLDGEILSSLLGADWTRGRGIAGVLLSHAQGKGDGDGAMESTLTGLYPYGHYAISDHLSAWSVFGYSRGELALVPTGGTALEAGIGLAMAAAGARGTVLDGDRNGLTLALISDGMAMRTTSEAVEGLVSSEADVTRLRLGLEGSRPLRLEGGSVLTPAIEIGARHDGGDAETGYGADLGASLAWSYPKRGLKAKVQGRGLVAHQDSDFQERGFAGSLAWDPMPASELGPSFTLQETVGAAATGGMRALMQRDSPAGLATNEVRGGGRVEAELGYGLPVWSGRFAGIPSFRFGYADGGRTARLGYRLSPISAEGWQLKLAVEAMRRESANANRPTDHFVGMRAGMRW